MWRSKTFTDRMLAQQRFLKLPVNQQLGVRWRHHIYLTIVYIDV